VAPPAPQHDPFGLVGSVLERQFRVDAMVGEGGFGVVYKGWHLTLDQPIAIKALKMPEAGDAATQATILAKFREEAKLSYVLSQSTLHIVRTIDFGATSTPVGAWVPFAVLEWLEGETLAQNLARRRAQRMRGRSFAEMMTLLAPAAQALALAHQKRVAHRDIKPGNVFLLASGAPALKLLDFGIAKVMREGATAGGSPVQTTGFLSFTPMYAAPEQLDSRLGPTGPWTDVYGFALVVTEVLTDRAPFDGDDVTTILKAALDTHRRPSPRARGANVTDAVEGVIARALAVDPKVRFTDAGEMWRALEHAARQQPPITTPPPRQTPPPQTPPPQTPPPQSMPPRYSAPPAMLAPMSPPSYAPHAPSPYVTGPPSSLGATTRPPRKGSGDIIVGVMIGAGLLVLMIVLFVVWDLSGRRSAPPPAAQASVEGVWDFDSIDPMGTPAERAEASRELAGSVVEVNNGLVVLSPKNGSPFHAHRYAYPLPAGASIIATESHDAGTERVELVLRGDGKLVLRLDHPHVSVVYRHR
jgi:serine/threonine protein kinase